MRYGDCDFLEVAKLIPGNQVSIAPRHTCRWSDLKRLVRMHSVRSLIIFLQNIPHTEPAICLILNIQRLELFSITKFATLDHERKAKKI